MSEKSINLFVPGRLCLFGEHSDWAGMYRTVNSSIVKGAAIVSGTEQGIYATVKKSDCFIMRSSPEMPDDDYWECEMDSQKLLDIAQQGGYYSYVAGVASYINDNYRVGGVEITIQKRDLPLKSGLSSSAAICVLVARAFNQLYDLKMNIKGEMQAAFRGEQRTPSRCGRLDQACAYGIKPVIVEFDGVEIDSRELKVGGTFNWVIANLMSSKDTIKILSDLNAAYPFAKDEHDLRIQEALGTDNLEIVNRAIKYLEDGNSKALGSLMVEAQRNFDLKVAPASSELKSPVLHSVLNDPEIQKFIYGAKGVGSQGDGTVQFLAKGADESLALQNYLIEKRGMPSFTLTLKPGQNVTKAIIPLAGFGTRVFPATKTIKKCFLPILDDDGLLKPALLIMLEMLFASGIEDICLIIGEEDKPEFDKFFLPLSEENRSKLPQDKKDYEDIILEMRNHISFVFQRERLGFGHAVWLAKSFSESEPVLLLLGDFLYKSNSDISCTKQIIEAFKETGKTLVSVNEISLNQVVHYGIIHGVWNDENEKVMTVDSMVEKPTDDYAKEYLGVKNKTGKDKYYATFGQYILTPEVFDELDREISGNPTEGNEYGLTSALNNVRKKNGLIAFVPDGKSFDIGLPNAYFDTFCNYASGGKS